jgi:hypothetical protein
MPGQPELRETRQAEASLSCRGIRSMRHQLRLPTPSQPMPLKKLADPAPQEFARPEQELWDIF